MKIIKSIIFTSALLAFLPSCDMEKYPYDKLPVENAIQSVDDCEKLRSGMYRDLRIISFATNSLSSDFQADQFIPGSYYGGQYSGQYRWDAAASDDTFRIVWGNAYVTIAQCNLLIQGCVNLMANGGLDDDEKATLKNILGEAYFVRAFANAMLADRYCKTYDPTTAESDYGVPLVVTYEPTADNSKYPGRETLAVTYNSIKDDIELARQNLTTNGEQSSIYLTVDALDAFEARIALLTKDYDTAISKAEGLVNRNAYPLISQQEAFNTMWKQDVSTEVICQLYADKLEPAYSMGGDFLDEINHMPRFLPSKDLIDMYSETDIRKSTFFMEEEVAFSQSTKVNLFVFNKYPGNPDFNDGANRYINKLKLFRVAEQYLIAAEAYQAKGGIENEKKAYDILFKLMSARDNALQKPETAPVGNTLRDLIRSERQKELVGEGFRLTDLKRYGEGFKRQKAQDEENSYQIALNLEISSDNNRWLWAIPQDEIESNPQIKGQQNPGY